MGYLSTFLSRSRVAFDRLSTRFDRQSHRLLSKRRLDLAGRLDGAKAYLKKRSRQLRRESRVLLGKVAAKTTLSSR